MPSKKDTALLTNLRNASARLIEVGNPELAATVDDLLTPGGWGRLRSALSSDTIPPNLAINMPLVMRAAIQQAAKKAGRTIPDDVTEGLEAFIAGSFSPAENAHRVHRGSGMEFGNLNVRVDTGLRSRFQNAVDEKEPTLGYRPTIGYVAKAWLIQKYKIPAASKLAEKA